MRKQLLVIISVALASFLVGTIFSTNYLASGVKPPSAWDAINELQAKVNSLNNTVAEQQAQISELQGRISTIEEQTSHVKTIRFYDPSEHRTAYVNEWEWETVFTFEWTPTDSTNNVILEMVVYAEVNCTVEPPLEACLCWQANFTGNLPWVDQYTVGSGVTSYEDLEYTWTETVSSPVSHWIPPNQPTYVFDFQILCRNGIAYFRNINIIMTVADRLPV